MALELILGCRTTLRKKHPFRSAFCWWSEWCYSATNSYAVRVYFSTPKPTLNVGISNANCIGVPLHTTFSLGEHLCESGAVNTQEPPCCSLQMTANPFPLYFMFATANTFFCMVFMLLMVLVFMVAVVLLIVVMLFIVLRVKLQITLQI